MIHNWENIREHSRISGNIQPLINSKWVAEPTLDGLPATPPLEAYQETFQLNSRPTLFHRSLASQFYWIKHHESNGATHNKIAPTFFLPVGVKVERICKDWCRLPAMPPSMLHIQGGDSKCRANTRVPSATSSWTLKPSWSLISRAKNTRNDWGQQMRSWCHRRRLSYLMKISTWKITPFSHLLKIRAL